MFGTLKSIFLPHTPVPEKSYNYTISYQFEQHPNGKFDYNQFFSGRPTNGDEGQGFQEGASRQYLSKLDEMNEFTSNVSK